jgi:hypothetical protein
MKYTMLELASENCLTIVDGQKVYAQIHHLLLNGETVELDFAGVKRFASPFFNFAIAQLLADIKADDLSRLLIISNINPVGQQAFDRVIENAKRYYTDLQYRDAIEHMIQEQVACV